MLVYTKPYKRIAYLRATLLLDTLVMVALLCGTGYRMETSNNSGEVSDFLCVHAPLAFGAHGTSRSARAA